jgi:hypothetical protein
MTEETFFVCPYCLETISILVDLSQDGPVSYVEDCEVCCHPISIRYQVEENVLLGFQAASD